MAFLRLCMLDTKRRLTTVHSMEMWKCYDRNCYFFSSDFFVLLLCLVTDIRAGRLDTLSSKGKIILYAKYPYLMMWFLLWKDQTYRVKLNMKYHNNPYSSLRRGIYAAGPLTDHWPTKGGSDRTYMTRWTEDASNRTMARPQWFFVYTDKRCLINLYHRKRLNFIQRSVKQITMPSLSPFLHLITLTRL